MQALISLAQVASFVAPRPLGCTREDIQAIAHDTRQRLVFQTGDRMAGLMIRLNNLRPYALLPQGLSLMARGATEFHIQLPSITTDAYNMFLLAHELGHLTLHLPEALTRGDQMAAPTSTDATNLVGHAADIEANIFAFEFLMPRADIQIDENRMGVDAIARKYGVSLRIAQLRCGLAPCTT